ncbi:hypothetical protein KP509_11G066100 [Ceratopteris richardii]|nr:hypothetical protein KP509_11G066100 [Ceratopteris richardii]
MHICKSGSLEKDNFIGSALVNMFAKCSLFHRAQTVLEKFPVQDAASWNALIAGYVDQGQDENGLNCFSKMHKLRAPISSVTLVCCFVACGNIGNVIKGHELHGEALQRGFECELSVGNSLIDMYAKFGQLDTAHQVFENLTTRDAISWNILLTGHVEAGWNDKALQIYELMHETSFIPNDVTYLCSLKACASTGTLSKGWEIHDEIIKIGLEKEPLIGNSLVSMYAKCGLLATAETVLHSLPKSDLISWNAMLGAYAEHGCVEDALCCIESMYEEEVSPNSVTFTCLLKCFSSSGAVFEGFEVHIAGVKYGFENELLFGSVLVDMYFKCGFPDDAQSVFYKLEVRSIVSWNTLIGGYAKLGHGEEAICCFLKMVSEGVSPCATTFVCLLKACSSIGLPNQHQQLHREIIVKGLDGDLVVSNVLVDLYMKYGMVAESQNIFYKLPDQDLVSWSSLISGLTEQGLYEEVLKSLEDMQHQSISLNSVIYVCGLKACSSVGMVNKGQELHMAVLKQGLEMESLVGNILVDMYASSGCLPEANHVFETLSTREVVAWNALIAGYAQLGESEEAVNILDGMMKGGGIPDHITFLSILHACSHSGVVDSGLQCFETIIHSYSLLPTLKQYTCIVDVLSRAGFVEMVVGLIEKIPFQPDIAVWLIVLGASRKWADVKIGRIAFEQAVELSNNDCTAYVCMSYIYKEASMQEEARIIDALRFNKKSLEQSQSSCSRYTNELMGDCGVESFL